MTEYISPHTVEYLAYLLIGSCSFSLVCAGISYIIDAKGRFNFNTYGDDKDTNDESKSK